MNDLTFNLNYAERAMLLTALHMYRERYGDTFAAIGQGKDVAEALAMRISRLECQPGGCSYCTGENDD